MFGDIADLKVLARERLARLEARGDAGAPSLYGIDERAQPGTGGLNAFFLLQDRPEAYNLPPDPVVPTEHGKRSWIAAAGAMLGLAILMGAAVRAAEEP